LTELPQRQQLAEPEQQQPALAGARNSSTTCYAASEKISKRA